MPSYLVSAKESYVPLSLYKPPVEALGDMLRIKQQQYLQGFNSVNSNYNLIQNAAITDETGQLTAQKEKYISDATRQLKDLSKVDLSLPQNVEAANKVFDPMLNDQALMMNIRGTQHNTAQIQKLYQWRDSKDEKERDLYDPAALQHLLDDRERLAKAGTDLNKYKEFKSSRAVAFTNVQKYLDELAVKEKVGEIKRDSISGDRAYILTSSGAKIDYATWAASKLDDSRFNEQFGIMGDVEYNRRVRLASRDPKYAGYNEDQIKGVVREEMRTAVSNSYDEQIKQAKAQLDLNKNEALQIGDIDPNATDEPTRRALQKLEQLKSMKQSLEQRVVQLESNKKEVGTQLDRNPEGYFGMLAKQKMIDSWATGKAAVGSNEIKKNDAYFSAEQLKLDYMKYRLDIRKEDREDRELQAKIDGKIGSGSGDSNSSSDGNTYPDGTPRDVVQIGTATNEVEDKGKAWGVYQKHMGDMQGRIIQSLYNSNTGVIRVLAKALNASDEDIMYLGSALSNQEQLGPDYKFTKEQAEASGRIAPLLETYTGIKVTGPETAKQAIFKAAGIYFSKAHEEKRQLDPEMGAIMMSFNTAETTYKEAAALRDQEKKMITQNVISRSEYAPLVVEKDGQKALVGTSDIAKNFDNLYFTDEDGKTKKLTKEMKEDLAAQYMSGKVPYKFGKKSVPTPGGMSYQEDLEKGVAEIGGREVNISGDVYGALHNIGVKHGTPDKFKNLYSKALNSIVPNMKFFQDRTGQVNAEIITPFIPGAKVRGETAVRVMQELSSTSNVGDFFVTSPSGQRERVNAEDRAKILGMIRDEDTIEKFFDNPVMIPAQGLVKFRLKPGLSADVLKANGLDTLVNRDFVAQVSENAKGSVLNNLKVSDAFYVHSKLLEGKPVTSSTLMDAAGFSFKILPDRDDSNAQTATIHFKYKKWNPEKKDWDDATAKSQPFPIKGSGALSPDQLYNQASSMIFKEWNGALAASASTSTGPRVSALKLYQE